MIYTHVSLTSDSHAQNSTINQSCQAAVEKISQVQTELEAEATVLPAIPAV